MVKDIDLGFEDFLTAIRGIKGKRVVVGVFDEKVAEYALINEFGTERIPQRSFLRSTMDENQNAVITEYVKAYNETQDFDLAMESAGEFLKNKVIAKITSGEFPPNAPATIKKKGTNQPLIDTGTLINSIDYVVREE